MIISATGFFSWFWSPSFWLPPHVTWDTIEHLKVQKVNHDESENYPEFSDLLYTIPMALAMMLMRLVVERAIFRPLGLRLGLKDIKRHLPVQNKVLEEAFRKSGVAKQEDLKTLCVASGMSEIQVGVGLWGEFTASSSYFPFMREQARMLQ